MNIIRKGEERLAADMKRRRQLSGGQGQGDEWINSDQEWGKDEDLLSNLEALKDDSIVKEEGGNLLDWKYNWR
jgi:hypothetical protein